MSRGTWARAGETPRTMDSDSEPGVRKMKKENIVRKIIPSQGQCYDVQVSLRHSDRPWEGHRQLWNPDRRPLMVSRKGVFGILLEAGSVLR